MKMRYSVVLIPGTPCVFLDILSFADRKAIIIKQFQEEVAAIKRVIQVRKYFAIAPFRSHQFVESDIMLK